MNDTDRKLLTEYLGECWHLTNGGVSEDLVSFKCSVCGKWLHLVDIEFGAQRTFTSEADMMDLYQKMAERGEWEKLYGYAKIVFIREGGSTYGDDLAIWLFCLSGEGYGERCQMVAEFLKSKGEKQQ